YTRHYRKFYLIYLQVSCQQYIIPHVDSVITGRFAAHPDSDHILIGTKNEEITAVLWYSAARRPCCSTQFRAADAGADDCCCDAQRRSWLGHSVRYTRRYPGDDSCRSGVR